MNDYIWGFSSLCLIFLEYRVHVAKVTVRIGDPCDPRNRMSVGPFKIYN